MADLLSEVKTVRPSDNDDQEPALLALDTKQRRDPLVPKDIKADDHSTKEGNSGSPSTRTVSSEQPENILLTLKTEPDSATLLNCLRSLSSKDISTNNFTLAAPGPLQAQIVKVLVISIVPTFWSTLQSKDRQVLISCLRNVTGINAVLSRIRSLSNATGNAKHQSRPEDLSELISVTEHVFRGTDAVFNLWDDLGKCSAESAKTQLTWKETVNLLGSGKVTSIIAQAIDSVKHQDAAVQKATTWLASGPQYAEWLGSNIAEQLARNLRPAVEAAAQLFSKSLNLGHSAPLLKGLFMASTASTRPNDPGAASLVTLSECLPAHSARRLLEQTSKWLSDLTSEDSGDPHESTDNSRSVTAIAGLLAALSETSRECSMISDLLSDPSFSSTTSMPVRRACVAVIAHLDPDELQTLLEKTTTSFGDRLFINHAPMLQQESLAQTILLVAGYLHRQTAMAVLMIARSSSQMQGVSNRLDTSSRRARWLGMIVATTMSSLVDKEDAKMSFGVDELRTQESQWYMRLVSVHDAVGTLEDFELFMKSQERAGKRSRRSKRQIKPEQPRMLNGKPIFGPLRPPIVQSRQTEVIGDKVTELLDDTSDDDSDDDDELKPYAKPDSDPEDSDEDATMVNRNKPRAPVYVRDLMRMLSEDKDHDKFLLAITHAAGLIRRKASFGGEVKDHSEELLRLLCNLQDPFSIDGFDEHRLQAIIAVLMSDMETLAPWLSRQAFAGDYALAQRCIMLSALGLAGRELAGYKNEDELNPSLPSSGFPTKRLPPRLHAIYAPADTAVKHLDSVFTRQEHQLMRPMALQAADQSTAHLNAVKVRTFSSRMELERTKRKPAPNQLAQIFGSAFFFPLLGRYQQDLAAYGPGSLYSSAPFLLVTFLKTLALLFHASGPATLGLARITADFWDLLLGLRVQASSDITVMEAVLFAFLTLLEMNPDKRRLAEERPKQLVETQQWVEAIFERSGGSELIVDGSEEESKIRTLAAGVLVKTNEVVAAYQKQLFGQTIG